MAPINKKRALGRIKSILGSYKTIRKADQAILDELSGGKLYELYVLVDLLRDLRSRGFDLHFEGSTIEFKASPGHIWHSDPHFTVYVPGNPDPVFRIFTDIEFLTLGSSHARLTVATDVSSYHEIDIVVVDANATGRPRHDQIALGIECKSQEKFQKWMIKQALGIRRELSYLRDPEPSTLSEVQPLGGELVPAFPPSEFWLVYRDAKGNDYAASPAAFGVKLKQVAV